MTANALSCDITEDLPRERTRDLYKDYQYGTIGLFLKGNRYRTYPLTHSSCYDATDLKDETINFYFNNKNTDIQADSEEAHKYMSAIVIRSYNYKMGESLPVIIDYRRNRSRGSTATEWVLNDDINVDRNSILTADTFTVQHSEITSNDRNNVTVDDILAAPQEMSKLLMNKQSIWPALVALVKNGTAKVVQNPRLHKSIVFFPMQDVQTIKGGTTTIQLFLHKYSDSSDPQWDNYLSVRTKGVDCLYLKYTIPDLDAVLSAGNIGKDYFVLKMREDARCISQ